MPHISLTLYSGRSESELEKLCANLQQCLVETAGWKPGDISVSVEGVEADRFVSQVKRKAEGEALVIPSDLIK